MTKLRFAGVVIGYQDISSGEANAALRHRASRVKKAHIHDGATWRCQQERARFFVITTTGASA